MKCLPVLGMSADPGPSKPVNAMATQCVKTWRASRSVWHSVIREVDKTGVDKKGVDETGINRSNTLEFSTNCVGKNFVSRL